MSKHCKYIRSVFVFDILMIDLTPSCSSFGGEDGWVLERTTYPSSCTCQLANSVSFFLHLISIIIDYW